MTTLVQDILRIRHNSSGAPQRKECTQRFEQSVPVSVNNCVHELFEAQADRSPEALALICGNREFTYRELNTRANQLARFLRRFDVGPNSLIGLCVERSAEMIVGILGILKAGAAYVPMDPSYSSQDLSFLMRNTNVYVLLTQSTLLDSIPRHEGPRVSLDLNWSVIARERKTNPPRRASLRNLAYVIYSPSQQRIVRISHRGLLNYLSWGAEAYEVAKGFGSTIDSSIPFDLAITRVLSPLMVGRSVLLPAERAGNSFTDSQTDFADDCSVVF